MPEARRRKECAADEMRLSLRAARRVYAVR